MDKIIIRSSVSLATLHNRRDFGKRLDKIEKLISPKPKEKGKKENA
jgi:hypothetical protein